jgi:hypothetical protein
MDLHSVATQRERRRRGCLRPAGEGGEEAELRWKDAWIWTETRPSLSLTEVGRDSGACEGLGERGRGVRAPDSVNRWHHTSHWHIGPTPQISANGKDTRHRWQRNCVCPYLRPLGGLRLALARPFHSSKFLLRLRSRTPWLASSPREP